MKSFFKVISFLLCGFYLVHAFAEQPKTQVSATTQTDPEKKEAAKEFSLSLGNILSASKEIAGHKPSTRVCPISGKDIIISGNTYEVRFFFFECKHNSLSKDTTFEEFVKEKNLLTQSPKIMDQGYGPVMFFSSPEELKKEGIHYLLALRYQPE